MSGVAAVRGKPWAHREAREKRRVAPARALTVGQKQRVVFSRRGQDLSLYVDGSESCKASLDSYTDPSGFVPVSIGAHYIGDQLTKAPFFGKIENTVVKRGSLAPPPALAP